VLPDQRRKKLLEVLGLSGAADVARLSGTLDVSPATVRRDLQYLADQGFLRRTHGGAVLPFESTAFYPQHDNKLQRNQAEKLAIARAAAQRVANGDVVVLDSGTTTLLLARELRVRRDLTVVTSDLKIALELADVPGFEVICVGGTVRPRSYNTLGAFAEEMLRELHANHTFLGADGIDLRVGVTNATVVEVPVKRLMMRSGLHVTLIADHSKFGRVGLAKVAELTDFAEIITGSVLPPKTLELYRATGARFTVASDDGEEP
jgi:DeoR family transcriptional regulator, fructose operon transcriptional repressor